MPLINNHPFLYVSMTGFICPRVLSQHSINENDINRLVVGCDAQLYLRQFIIKNMAYLYETQTTAAAGSAIRELYFVLGYTERQNMLNDIIRTWSENNGFN